MLTSIAYVILLAFAIPLALAFLAIILVVRILGCLWFLPGRALAAVATVLIAVLLIAPAAYAQSPSDIVGAICSTEGQSILVWALGAVGAASAVAWSQRVMGKLPKPIQALVHFVALNWPTMVAVMKAPKA